MSALPKTSREQLIVVSNRLPFVAERDDHGEWRVKPGSGGLVTALVPVLRDRGGTWIGWPGSTGDDQAIAEALERSHEEAGYRLVPVALTSDEVHGFYQGFSNEVLWPLFHDLHTHCNFDPAYWKSYCQTNTKYARVILEHCTPGDFIWVHDYQLINVASELRARGVSNRVGFFLHIPFPSLDIFLKLPWRFQILHALLEYDVIGFQTLRDRRNFTQCVRALIKEVSIHGKGSVVVARTDKREVRIGSFPISIDARALAQEAASTEVAAKVAQLRALLPERQLLLGIDRLDYTKAIPERLQAFAVALERYPDLHQRVTLIQVVVPSREDIPRYHDLRRRIEGLVGHINGRFTQPGGWVPIHYVFQHLSHTDLVAYYRAAQIALVTPIKDGMNLVAKEFCACSIEEDCVLVLSEFAGAAGQLQHGALLVNPYDVEGVAEAIHAACTMGTEECRRRMRRLRRSIQTYDVFWWVDTFLRAAIEKDLSAFPVLEDYIPHEPHAPAP